MTKKHRIEHFLSSIVGIHVHSDSSGVLEKKKEMEKNLEKILKLVGDENHETGTDPEFSLDSVHKSELSSLVKEFHNGYEALYENYDHLIGKLKNKIRPKKRGNGNVQSKHSSSSSDASDSDLDESAPLMAKLEEKEAVIRNLDNKLESVAGENEALKLENSMVKQNFEKEMEERESVISSLKNKIESVCGENEMLKLENEEARREILKFEKEVEEKESVISNLKNELEKETLKLREELEEKDLGISNLQKEMEIRATFENENRDLHERVRVICEENEKLMQISKFEIDQLRDEVSNLNEKMEEKNQLETDLSRQLNEANIEKEALISTNSGLLCEIKEAEERRESLKLMLERANARVEELGSKLVSVEEENKNLQEEIERLCSKLQEEESMVSELTVKFEQVTDEREKLFDANGDLNAKLESESMEKVELKQILEMKENENVLLASSVERREVELWVLTDERDKLNAIKSELENGIDDLKNKLKILEGEREGMEVHLREELEEKDLVISNFQKEMENLNRQLNDANTEKEALISTNSGLLCEIKEAEEDRENLKLMLERANARVEDLGSKLVSVEIENKNLQEEIERLCSKLQEEESMVSELTVKFEQVKDEREKLFDANGDLNAKLESESMEKAELKQILEMKENENVLLASSVERREVELRVLTDEREKLNAIKFELENGIDDLKNKLKVLEGEKEEVEVHLRQMEKGLEEARFANLELQMEIENLSTEKLKTEEEVKLIFEKCLENLGLVKNWEERLRGKIVNQEICVADLGFCFEELVSTCKELRDAYLDSMVHIAELEALSTEQTGELRSLEKTHLDLKEKLTISEGEVAKLNAQFQALEVQLRLSNQKLKITETESRYKEENSRKLVEGLNAKVRELEGQIAKMIAKLSFLENHLVQTEENAKVGISALGNRIKELKSIFDERFSSFVSRVLELNEELKYLKKNLDEELSEKERLKIRLGELERRVRKEEMEMKSKDEEKREVIRQLCMAIEYYRENCSLLIEISKRTRR